VAKGVATPPLLEKTPDGDAEIVEHFGQRKFLVTWNEARRLVGMENVGGFRLLVQDADKRHACRQIFANFDVNFPPPIAGGTHLENKLGRDGKVSTGQRPTWRSGVTVEGGIAAPNGVRISFGDDAGVVADHPADGMAFEILHDEKNATGADFTMSRKWKVHRYDDSSNQFRRPPVVWQSGVFLSSQQGCGGRHGEVLLRDESTSANITVVPIGGKSQRSVGALDIPCISSAARGPDVGLHEEKK
jgi:hypothetical protein